MSIGGKKFIDLQARLDAQVSAMVLKLQPKVDELETELKQIAEKYPTNPTVITKLGRFLHTESRQSTPRPVGVTPMGSVGRPRVKPRWFAEWNDGTSAEFSPNPNRNLLADIVKENPSGSIQFALSDNKNYIVVRVNDQVCQLNNPYPENQSGLKVVALR